MTDKKTMLHTLKKNGFDIADSGIGLNIKAQTRYEQYIIYLQESHIWDPHEHLSNRISELLDVSVDGISGVHFRKDDNLISEVWVFINLENKKNKN